MHRPDDDDAGAMPLFANPIDRNEQASLRPSKKRIIVPIMEDRSSISTTQGTDASAELHLMNIVEAGANFESFDYQENIARIKETSKNKLDEQDSVSQSTPSGQGPHEDSLASDPGPQDKSSCTPPDLERGIAIDPASEAGASLASQGHAIQHIASLHSGLVETEQKEDDVGILETQELEEGAVQERQPGSEEDIVLDAVVERCDANIAEEGEQERKCGRCGWRTKCLIWGSAWSLVILIAVLLNGRPQKGGDKDAEYLLTLLPADTVGAVALGAAVGSPQAKAFTWLSKDPSFQGGEYSDDRILQRFALATFYFAMGGGNDNSHEWNHHYNWLSRSIHECSWRGLSCNRATKEVAIIDLDNNKLDGSFPSELFWLSNLQLLKLSDNHISGKLPTSMVAMTNLIALYLNGNRLESTIPSELASLTKLETLELQQNDLTGAIPDDLGGMTSLKQMNLAGNNLSGTIPSNLGNSQALQMLNLSRNSLAGSVPSSLGRVAELLLDDNMFTGSTPGGLDGDGP